jgi:hypothetical protein
MIANRSVFTSRNMPSNRVVSIREVTECVEVTGSMSKKEKVQYFYSVGIDHDNVEMYGPVVEKFNRLIQVPDSSRNNINPSFLDKLYKIHVATMFCILYIWL